MLSVQRPIRFENDCNAIADLSELAKAMQWYSDKPQVSIKHIFMHGRYPAVSIHGDKVHIHRLLMSFWLQAKIPTDYFVHHINENRMDARKENLSLVLNKVHNSQHNKGRKPSKKAVDKLIAFNHTRKGTKQKYKRSDIPLSKVESMIQEGYSINRISQILNCDWSTIKSRLNEIHDNPDLLK